jgi:hypothetical protein
MYRLHLNLPSVTLRSGFPADTFCEFGIFHIRDNPPPGLSHPP